MPQRVDTEGLGFEASQQEADTEAKRASAKLQSHRRGFRGIGLGILVSEYRGIVVVYFSRSSESVRHPVVLR